MTDLEQFIVSLPKAEVHVHLEGAVDMDALSELAQRHGQPPPPPNLYRYAGFGSFLKAFQDGL